MNVMVLGSNGRTGREVVARLLERGHRVTAVVRSADRWTEPTPERLQVVVASAIEPTELARVAPGHDALISVLGPRWPSRAACQVYEASGAAFAAVLPGAGVKRLLVTSSGLLFPTKAWLAALLRRLVPSVVSASQRMEDYIRRMNLDWTIVRTDFLTDGSSDGVGPVRRDSGGQWADFGAEIRLQRPRKRGPEATNVAALKESDTRCRAEVGRMPNPGGAVSRRAVAALLVQRLEQGCDVRATLGVSGP